MAIDQKAIVKYLVLGAGAVAIPMVAMNVSALAGLMNNAFLGYVIYGGVKVADILLAAVGVGVADQLMG